MGRVELSWAAGISSSWAAYESSIPEDGSRTAGSASLRGTTGAAPGEASRLAPGSDCCIGLEYGSRLTPGDVSRLASGEASRLEKGVHCLPTSARTSLPARDGALHASPDRALHASPDRALDASLDGAVHASLDGATRSSPDGAVHASSDGAARAVMTRGHCSVRCPSPSSAWMSDS